MRGMKYWVSGMVSAVVLLPGMAFSNDEIQDMENVVVVGQRAMMQNALDRQRNDDHIKSVVTRDAIGQFPDQNIAEAVRRDIRARLQQTRYSLRARNGGVHLPGVLPEARLLTA